MSSIRVLIDNEQRITTKINKTRATVHFNRRQATSTLDKHRFPLVSILTDIPKALTFVGQETTFQHQQISMQGQFLNEFVDETRFLHDLFHLCPHDFDHRFSFRCVQFHEPESSEMRFVIVPLVEDLVNGESGCGETKRACPTYLLTDSIRFSIGSVRRMKTKFLQLVEDRSTKTINIHLRQL